MPCVAKHLLSPVLSQTPGNFLAENTWKTSLKHEARTGAFPVLTIEFALACCPLGAVDGGPTLTKEKRNLRDRLVPPASSCQYSLVAYLKRPSVLTLRSWRMNQIPILSDGSVRRKALAARLPMRFRVNMPCG